MCEDLMPRRASSPLQLYRAVQTFVPFPIALTPRHSPRVIRLLSPVWRLTTPLPTLLALRPEYAEPES